MNRTAAIVHLVPHLPPRLEGVGAYALALARALREEGARDSRFVVGDPGWQGGDDLGFPAAAVAERTAAALGTALAAAGPGPLLVHYAGYGYHPAGTPEWLVAGIEAERPRRRTVTVFHEAYATGPPWRRSFWTAPRQRRLARRLGAAGDGAVTSLALYARLLRTLGVTTPVRVLPVPSTLGEPAAVPPWPARHPRLVVFGGPGHRRAAFHRHRRQLLRACGALGVTEVLEAGPGAVEPTPLPGILVRSLRALPEVELSALLAGSRAGFVSYPPAFFPKSSVFAALCAHGTPAVCPHRGSAPGEGLAAGVHFLGPEAPGADPVAVAEAARRWYQGHRLAVQAREIAALLGEGAR
jgi:glycosyltransferase involved in cell wall biosynthesis